MSLYDSPESWRAFHCRGITALASSSGTASWISRYALNTGYPSQRVSMMPVSSATDRHMRTRRTAGFLALLGAAAITALAALHWHDLHYPACAGCDASYYGFLALDIKRVGLFGRWAGSDMRTYGYPFFISLVSSEHDLTLPMAGYFTPNVAIAQSALYIASCLALFFVVFPTSRQLAWCCAGGLLCNPFVLNYVPLRLTEGLNASILISLTAIVCALSLRVRGLFQLCALLLAGSLLAGFALVLRPANLAVLGAWLIFVAFRLFRAREHRAVLAVCAVVGLAIPLLPQIYLNAVYNGLFTPLPAYASGAEQLMLGLFSVKYETNATGVGPLQLFYGNPFIDRREALELGWEIYVWRPQQGIPTLLAHIFNSVNHSYFFTYLHDFNPWYYAPMNAVNHLMLFAAAGAAVSFALSRRQQAMKGLPVSIADGLWLFLVLGFLLSCGVNSLTQPETRFGLAVFCLSGPLAAWGIYRWALADAKTKIVLLVSCLTYVIAAKLVSDWMLTLVRYTNPWWFA
jgi:hypothetical protein